MDKSIVLPEDENEDSTSVLNINAPSIMEITLDKQTTEDVVYGDFSMNSFLVVDTPEKETKEEVSAVYMESIIDLMLSLNTKIDTLRNEKSEEKFVLERVMSFLSIGDSASAEEAIQCYSNNNNPKLPEILMNLIQKTVPQFFINLKEELLITKEITFSLKNIYTETDNKLFKKLEENERLKNIINQQNMDHTLLINNLSKENNYLKDEILKIATEYGSIKSVDSHLEQDILDDLKSLIQNRNKEIDSLKIQLSKKETALMEYQMKEENFDITHLNSLLDSLRKQQKKIQDENLNLTNIVTKLSEKNTKLKHELIYFNSELKKAMEVIGKKNDTIVRQKGLIELFQEKISGGSFPIDELRKKKQEAERRLVQEKDYFVKRDLKKESEDCEKRISDFLSLNRRR